VHGLRSTSTCLRQIANYGSHCPNAMGVGWAEGSVTVTKQVTWRFVLRKGVGYLSGELRGGRIGSHTDRDQEPAGVTQDHQAIEQLERDRGTTKQIQRSDACGMIAQESLPTLGWWSAGAGPCTCRRLIQRLRSQASTIRRGSAVRPIASSRGSSAGSALESLNPSVDGRRHGGTSSANKRGNRVGAKGSRSPAGR
jgi:hypothetical protein